MIMSPFNLISKIELISQEGKKTLGIIHDIIDNKIYVSIPSDDKQFKILRVGDYINGIIYGENKATGFDAILTDRIIGDIPIYELSFVGNFSNIQRREFVRVLCSIPILYSDNKYLLNINDVNDETRDSIQNIERYLNSGVTSDISAGGLRFSCNQDFHIGKKLLLVFDIDNDFIVTKGEIVYKDIINSPTKAIYIYGIQFLNIREDKREKIMNYVFVLMRKNKLK